MRPLHEKNGLRDRKGRLAFTLVNRCINNVIAIQFYSTLFLILGRYTAWEDMRHKETPRQAGERGRKEKPPPSGEIYGGKDEPSLSGGRVDARRHVPFAGILSAGSLGTRAFSPQRFRKSTAKHGDSGRNEKLCSEGLAGIIAANDVVTAASEDSRPYARKQRIRGATGHEAPSQIAHGRKGAAGDPAAPDGHLISKRPGRRRA